MSKKKRTRPDTEPGTRGAPRPAGAQLDLAMRAEVEQGRLVVEQIEDAAPPAQAASAPAPVETTAAFAESTAVDPEAPAAGPVQAAAGGFDPEPQEQAGTEPAAMEAVTMEPVAVEPVGSESGPSEEALLAGDPAAAADAGTEAPPALVTVELPPPLSQRLRAAREAKGLSREEMARRMRVSPSVIQDIENDQWQRLGAAVYVRGHLTSYARSLGVPTIIVAHALKDMEAPVPLALTVAAPPSSAWRRHLSAATYVVLTLLLAIPVFNLVPKRGVNSPVPQVRGLDEAEMAVKPLTQALLPPVPESAADVLAGPPSSLAVTPNSDQVVPLLDIQAPLMASMTPMPGPGYAAESSGQRRIEMTFSEDSWLEMLDDSGDRIDYGMARAGERRVHLVRGPVSMIVGNANGAQLRVDGEMVDLGAFARLNVARLRLFESEPTSAAPSR